MEFKEEIEQIANKIANILVEKNKGYGNSFYDGLDEVKNLFKPFLAEHDFFSYIHHVSFFVREKDKLNRFKNLITSDIENKQESIYDSVLDIVGYGMLFLNYLEKHNFIEVDENEK